MAATLNYATLALNWQPTSQRDARFWLIIGPTLIVMLGIGIIFSAIDVPEPERRATTPVPERIAQFIEQKQKPTPPPPPPPPPPPKPKPKPTVERQLDKKRDKPLTDTQKKARQKAEETGLLALGNELADLFQTDEVSAIVGGDVSKRSRAATQAAGVNTDILTANAGNGSGGIDSSQYAAAIGGSAQLSARERTAVRQGLLVGENTAAAKDKSTKGKRRAGDNIRPEEDVTIVFDQNKGRLYSIYNRARRTNPGLQGKVVLEITISPAGNVTQARIISSELNDPTLERSLLARIKQFTFGEKDVEAVTVTFPIEFLPS